jgi:protein-tyrosine kinase
MEKLQSALNKARERRQAADGGAASVPQNHPSRAAAKGSLTSAVDTLWDELPAFKPVQKSLEENRVVTYKAGSAATSFDILRTKVLLQMRQNNWSRIAITSPTPRCGKTTTACNLGIGLSRHADIRSILFDLDLRRPAVGKYLGHYPQTGIRQLLQNKVPFSEQAIRFRSNMALCAARSPIVDPTSLLLSETASKVFDDIQAAYQPNVMLFDLPPFLVSDDTRAFLKNVDCALILVRAGETTVSQIDTCEKEISEHTNVMGVVLNQCQYVTDDTYGYSYESY